PTGVLISRKGTAAAVQLSQFDRSGANQQRLGELGDYTSLALSPDGARLAHTRTVEGHRAIWLLDLKHNIDTRLSFNAAGGDTPIWSPDGKYVAFSSLRPASREGLEIYIKDASNAGTEQAVLKSPTAKYLNDWSRDGK